MLVCCVAGITLDFGLAGVGVIFFLAMVHALLSSGVAGENQNVSHHTDINHQNGHRPCLPTLIANYVLSA